MIEDFGVGSFARYLRELESLRGTVQACDSGVAGRSRTAAMHDYFEVAALRRQVALLEKWPGKDVVDAAATVVFIGDLFPPETMPEPERIKAELAGAMDRGCGLVCVHYATGLRQQHVLEDGAHPLLQWLGGYFASGCPHHRSVARVCPATLTPAETDHPVLRGWKEFHFDDEPYWNNYFGKDGPAKNVTSLVTTMLSAACTSILMRQLK